MIIGVHVHRFSKSNIYIDLHLGPVFVFHFFVQINQMDYRALFPLVDFSEKYNFKSCLSMQVFISEVIAIYFSDSDLRVQECCLSVYMAFRDHYPSYLKNIDQESKKKLDFQITRAGGKVIKLRRIVIAAISKVA